MKILQAFSPGRCVLIRRYYSYLKPVLVLIILLLASTSFEACLTAQLPRRKEGCKMRAYINAGFMDYLSERYASDQMPRMAIFPFSVPETFAPIGNESVDFGRTLANLFHRELLKTGQIKIVEMFNRDSWPGKRAEFNNGNYYAIDLARNAGYDLMLVGYMEDITNESDLTIYTRIIDTSNSATIWYGKTVAYSNARGIRRTLAELPFFATDDRPDLFAFPERAENVALCTVERFLENQALMPKEIGVEAPKEFSEPNETPVNRTKRLPR